VALLTRKHTVNSRRVHEGGIIALRVDTLDSGDGRQWSREVVEHNGGVVIVCQPDEDQVLLIRQYRYPIDEYLLELPAGRVEVGEDPFVCAQRELIEETGYKASTWLDLVKMYSAPGFCDELLHVYLASDLTFVGKSLDEDEETEVLIMSIAQAWQLVKEGQVRDSKTIAGIAFLLHNRT
jgi:ADP-ribose pyrophosphatase